MAGIAKQLGHPSGLRGRLVGVALNRGNRRFVSAAVQALQPDTAAVVADVGFGGGVGLKFLLDSVGQSGRVHGVKSGRRGDGRPGTLREKAHAV
jgi:arsenite methyltransferase